MTYSPIMTLVDNINNNKKENMNIAEIWLKRLRK